MFNQGEVKMRDHPFLRTGAAAHAPTVYTSGGSTVMTSEHFHPALSPASPWVMRFAPLVEAGPVLDLACGGGRHGRLFLDRGLGVCFVDRTVEAVNDLRDHPGAEIVEADLEDGVAWPLAGRNFPAIIVANYLHRPRLDDLLDLLAPGGLMIYETFARGNEAYGRPRNPDHLLAPGELLGLAERRGLTVIAYEHGLRPAADGFRVIQRMCAVADGDPRPLNP